MNTVSQRLKHPATHLAMAGKQNHPASALLVILGGAALLLSACANNAPDDALAPASTLAGKPGYSDYLLEFEGFSAVNISDIQTYIDAFSCYDSHSLISQGDSTTFSYISCLSSAKLSENLTGMLDRLELSGELRFSDRSFTISMVGVNSASGCVFPGTDTAAPDWVCGEEIAGLTQQALGSAGPMRNLALAKTVAASRARVELARTRSASVEGKVSSSETSEGDRYNVTSKTTTDGQVEQATVERSAIGPDGTTYVLIGIRASARAEPRQ